MRHKQGSAQAISVNAEDHTIRQHCRWSGTLSCMIIRQIEMQGWSAGRLTFLHCTDLEKKKKSGMLYNLCCCVIIFETLSCALP